MSPFTSTPSIMDFVEARKIDISSSSLTMHVDPHLLVHKVNFFMKGTG